MSCNTGTKRRSSLLQQYLTKRSRRWLYNSGPEPLSTAVDLCTLSNSCWYWFTVRRSFLSVFANLSDRPTVERRLRSTCELPPTPHCLASGIRVATWR